ncbi:MAG: TIGR00282 family metallophosphoesterase [Nitrospirota bacterium]
MRIIFIGDIVGECGRKILRRQLNSLVRKERIDIIAVNVENAAGGFGITVNIAEEFLDMGIHVMTSGNHIWDKKEIINYLNKQERLLRPANYPEGVPGFGSTILNLKDGEKLGVLHLMGRIFMTPIDCPFRTAEREIEILKRETPNILVDFHAEATSEKVAMGLFLDGKVSAVIGTHTHVQTADEQVLPEGTGYITDVGMTGPFHSVIGIKKEQAIKKFLTHTPKRFEMAKGVGILSGILIEIDPVRGHTTGIERIQIKDNFK